MKTYGPIERVAIKMAISLYDLWKPTDKDYPVWVCDKCCKKAKAKKKSPISTYHEGTCGICKKTVAVTEPRDWGYPEFKKVHDEKE